MSDYETVADVAREAYIAGWKHSRGCENYSNIQVRTMDNRFDRWWQVHGPNPDQ